jgi:lipid A 4'-phosphatase
MTTKFKIALLLNVISSILLIIYSQVDIQISSLFYSAEQGFYLKDSWWVRLLYNSVPILLKTIVFGVIGLYIVNKIFKTKLLKVNGRITLYLLIALIVGPGLIVNSLFKDHFGRARPFTVTEFGGDRIFTPAFVITDQCEKNCSFSSGHAAGAFFVLALAFLMKKRREWWIALATVYGFGVGVARIAAGGHFFSDVFISYFVVLSISQLCYELIISQNTSVYEYLQQKFRFRSIKS